MNDVVLQSRGLRKLYGDKVAVGDLTLDVRRGEVFGFLGPNGAGKTTSLKMFLGLIAPTGGSACLLGRPLGDVDVRRRVGFLPEHFRFHDWLTASEFLTLHGQLYGLGSTRLKESVPALLELVGLIDHCDKKLRAFSKGMLQRIGLAQAILNEPDLIFLDEPTSGLDPVGRRLVRDIIRDQRRRGATVFLNSHLLGEVEVTCDRAAFIKHGEVLEIRNLQDVIDGEIVVSARVRNLTTETLKGLERWCRSVCVDGEQLTLHVLEDTHLPEITRYLVDCGGRVYELTPKRLSLEEVFLQIVGTDGGL